METKKKYKRNFKKTGRVVAKGISLFDGDTKHKHSFVPITLLDYDVSPEDKTEVHPFAQGFRFVLWMNFADAQWNGIEAQMKKGIKEINIFFDEENREKLKEFLKEKTENPIKDVKKEEEQTTLLKDLQPA